MNYKQSPKLSTTKKVVPKSTTSTTKPTQTPKTKTATKPSQKEVLQTPKNKPFLQVLVLLLNQKCGYFYCKEFC